jgi:hypothetical protein
MCWKAVNSNKKPKSPYENNIEKVSFPKNYFAILLSQLFKKQKVILAVTAI